MFHFLALLPMTLIYIVRDQPIYSLYPKFLIWNGTSIDFYHWGRQNCSLYAEFVIPNICCISRNAGYWSAAVQIHTADLGVEFSARFAAHDGPLCLAPSGFPPARCWTGDIDDIS